MTEYIHDEWCDLDKKGECDCVVSLLEAKDEEIESLRELDKAIGEAFKDYPYENESGIKKMTLQSFAVIQRIRKALEAKGE